MPPAHSNQRIAELQMLDALARTLNQTLDLRETLDEALRRIIELLGLETGWIFLAEDSASFALATRHALPPALGYPGKPWGGECRCQDLCRAGTLDQQVTMVRCTRLGTAIGDKRGLAQHASVPLRNGDELLGILNVATTEFGTLTAPQLHMLATAANLLATAIARSRLHEQVKVRRVQEQAALLRLSYELLQSDALEQALQRLVRVGARLLEADACAYVEADEEGGRALLRAAHGWALPTDAAWPLVLDAETPHLWYLPDQSVNLPRDAFSALPPLLAQQRFQGHIAVHLEIGGVPLGTLMVSCSTPRRFDADEAQLLGLLGSQLVQTLERERLYQEALERRSLERELELARDIQTSFLPSTAPRVPGYALAALYEPARQVGGDFYDFIRTPDSPDQLGIVIADVTDKGVPAALFMALSRTLLRATALDGHAPHAVLAKTNRLILADSRASLFVSCFYALLDTRQHTVTYANGGHNYPLLLRRATGEIEQLRANGIVLGVVDKPSFEQHQTLLAAGDVLFLYTDGVTEAMNSEREFFGEERLMQVLRRSATLSPAQIIAAVVAAVRDFVGNEARSDDITMVVLQRIGERRKT